MNSVRGGCARGRGRGVFGGLSGGVFGCGELGRCALLGQKRAGHFHNN